MDIRVSFSHARWSPGSDSTKVSGLQGNLTGPERPANTCHPKALRAQYHLTLPMNSHVYRHTYSTYMTYQLACFPKLNHTLLIRMHVARKIHTAVTRDKIHAINHTIARTQTHTLTETLYCLREVSSRDP